MTLGAAPGPAPGTTSGEQPRFGLGYRRAWRGALVAGRTSVEVLEVIPDHYFANPEAILPLAERYPIVLHDVGMSIGTPGIDRERLARIVEISRLARAVRFTDHLAVTRTPSGRMFGHLAPVPWRPEAVRTCVENLRILVGELQIPVAVENIFATFWPGTTGTGTTGPGGGGPFELLHEVVEQADVGLLLDVTNVLLEARNLREPPEDRLARLPLHRAVAVHLAGGLRGPRGYLDTHSRPVDSASLRLLASLRGRAPIEDVIVERDSHLPTIEDMNAEVIAARAAWGEAPAPEDRTWM